MRYGPEVMISNRYDHEVMESTAVYVVEIHGGGDSGVLGFIMQYPLGRYMEEKGFRTKVGYAWGYMVEELVGGQSLKWDMFDGDMWRR